MNSPLDIKGFTGGLADQDLSVTPQHYSRADNLLLTPEFDLVTRPGSACFDVNHAQLPSGLQRVNGLVNYDQDVNLLAISGNHAYVYNAGWTEIIGAVGDALHTGTAGASLSTAEWKKHIFIASSDLLTPVKIYKDNSGTFKVITAGLPFMATPASYNAATVLTSALNLANAIRSAMLVHFASTTRHKAADTVAAAFIGAAATDLPSLVTLTTQLIQAHVSHYNDYQGASRYHSAETNLAFTSPGDQALSNVTAPTDLTSVVARLNDIHPKYGAHVGKSDIHQALDATTAEFQLTYNLIFGVYDGPFAEMDQSVLCTFINNLKYTLVAHLSDSGAINAHSAFDSNYTSLNAAATCSDSQTLQDLYARVFADYTVHEDDAQHSPPLFHWAKENQIHSLAPDAYTSLGDSYGGLWSGNWDKWPDRLNDLQSKLSAHMVDMYNGSSAGAHKASSAYQLAGPSYYVTYSSQNGLLPAHALASYTYAFTYEYTYTTTSGTAFTMEGPPLLFEAKPVIPTSYQPLAISNIVPLANSSSTNFDLANIKINIYRTTSGGQTLFYVGQVANGTTTYSDTVTDTVLQTRRTIYTAGGVSDNEPAPRAKYVHITEDDFAYWGNILDDDGTPRPNRIRQAIAGSPDSVPGDYFVDLPYPVTGVNSIKGVRVAWTKKGTYRLEGTIDERGTGSIRAASISDSVGCVGGYGTVSTDQGIIFPGTDGFYVTNGYQVSKLSRDWKSTYLNLIRTDPVAQMIYGVSDKKTNRVWFTTSSTGTENDSCYILDLNLPLSENGPWTTASNRSYFAPSSICVFNDQIIRGDSHGYVLAHSDTVTSDPKIDTTKAATLWNITSIFPDYRSPHNDFGTIMFRKHVPKIVVKAKNRGNMSLQINSINDEGKNIAPLTPIRYRGSTTYGDPTILSVGGGPTLTNGGLPEYKRHFPSGSLRCSTKQVQFILAKVAITDSDVLGLGALVQATKVFTVAGAAFPDYVDHVLALANDGYVTEYTILSNTGTTLTVSDPGNVLPASGSYKWVVRGYPKDEQWQITNYLLYFNIFGTTQLFDTASNGENA